MKSNILLQLVFWAVSATAASDEEPAPKNFAVTLFHSFDSIDVTGPLNPLFYLAFSKQLNLSLIAPTYEPVWVAPALDSLNVMNSSMWFSLNPTHTYDNPPKDIDVLLIPGGAGATFGNVSRVIDFVREAFPSVKYLLSTCTGAGIAARAGVLDGKRATTNKKAWSTITGMGPNVNWVSPARWAVDGNVWTSSGVTSSLDMMFAFIEEMYGKDFANEIQGTIEHNRVTDPCDDPFAELHGVQPSGDCKVETKYYQTFPPRTPQLS